MKINTAIILITGACVLALELLVSRIMAPYFGVSLYIWTGILSITLISLALGYYLGGQLSHKYENRQERASHLEYLFLTMPAKSSISLTISCLIYPWAFLQLAQFDLVAGAFIACLLMLAFPLVTISAMNPLLIAMYAEKSESISRIGDSHSGLVFFISTMGSVFGVLITAFIFIPNMTNFRSVLCLALILSLMPLFATQLTTIINDETKRKKALLISLAGLLMSVSLLAYSSSFLNKDEIISHNKLWWEIKKEYTSFFGNTKIISVSRKQSPASSDTDKLDKPLLIYYQDGILQNTIDTTGEAQSIFSYALEGLASAFKPSADSALVLGLAGGVIPMKLAKRGLTVDAVEINPSALHAAQEFFSFDPSMVNVYEMDARNYVKQCPTKYDVVIVDLFQGDGIPDYLTTKEFFHDLNRCVNVDGIVIFNTFTIPRFMPSYYHFLKTLKTEFEKVLIFHDDIKDQNKSINLFLVATDMTRSEGQQASIDYVPPHLHKSLRNILARARPIDTDALRRADIISDEFNNFPLINIDNYLGYRKTAIDFFPWEVLVN